MLWSGQMRSLILIIILLKIYSDLLLKSRNIMQCKYSVIGKSPAIKLLGESTKILASNKVPKVLMQNGLFQNHMSCIKLLDPNYRCINMGFNYLILRSNQQQVIKINV